MQDFERAYIEGNNAGLDGKEYSENPYNKETNYDCWAHWYMGWQNGSHFVWAQETIDDYTE